MSSHPNIKTPLNSVLIDPISHHKFFSVIFLLFFTAVVSGVNAEDQKETFSDSNNLLFFSDHLGNISDSSKLVYNFVKAGSIEPGFEDTINLNIKPGKKAEERAITVDFFSGERKRWTPDFNGAEGNPLLTIFLQRDISEMQRLTDGKWRHFQKRIKLALENEAETTPVTVIFSGEEYRGKQITITPYVDDPFNKRFNKHKDKYYVFTLADELPGMIYQMTAVTPPTEGKTKTPLLSETITLKNINTQ